MLNTTHLKFTQSKHHLNYRYCETTCGEHISRPIQTLHLKPKLVGVLVYAYWPSTNAAENSLDRRRSNFIFDLFDVKFFIVPKKSLQTAFLSITIKNKTINISVQVRVA